MRISLLLLSWTRFRDTIFVYRTTDGGLNRRPSPVGYYERSITVAWQVGEAIPFFQIERDIFASMM
ncbi:hypothetical protein K435DRAFT_778580, partial [Dendrothele bispora CBS 962.96]